VGWRLGKKSQIKISKRFVAMENLNDRQDINMDWGKQRQYQTSTEESLRLFELK
jgi:hypothetical protein